MTPHKTILMFFWFSSLISSCIQAKLPFSLSLWQQGIQTTFPDFPGRSFNILLEEREPEGLGSVLNWNSGGFVFYL